MAKNKRKLPRYVAAFVDRHGKERFRFRKSGCAPCYLPPVGSADFAIAYEAALANVLIVGAGRARPRSINDLLARFYASNSFTTAGADRQGRIKGVLAPFKEEFGERLVASFTWEHIEAILAERAIKRECPKTKRTLGGSGASKNLEKHLTRAFEFARLKLRWIQTNPVSDADGVTHIRVGYHNWAEEEIDQYRDRHAVGTYARAALEIMLWTAQRKGDASTFGPSEMKGGKIKFVPSKTAKDQRVQWLDAAPALVEAIDALPAIGTKSFLVTSFGKPYTKDGFGNKVREWCDEAGLPHCTAHGLRKAAARRAAENGATQQEIKALGGWRSDQSVVPYIRDANQAVMGGNAVAKLVDFEAKKLSNR